MILFPRLLCRRLLFIRQLCSPNCLLAMRLTIILVLASIFQVSANGYSQTVTISLKNAPLQKAVAEIEKQTGYTFLYTDQMMQNLQPVDIVLKNVSLQEALDACFKSQPLSYTIVKKTVILKPRDKKAAAEEAKLMRIDISGRITDEEGNGLYGASVRVVGTDIGVRTDAHGYFKLPPVSNEASIEISFVGFQTVTLRANSFRLGVGLLALKRVNSPLDAVQIEAYRSNSRRISTSNINSVKSTEIETLPVSNPLLSLSGRVPGIFITQSSGISGTGIKVRIQGQNSIAHGNTPLYIVDGVPIISQFPGTGIDLAVSADGPQGSEAGNPLNFINVSDIESIDVLKDADATAIYGSRAANGAILITTKKGREGPTRLELNLQTGWGKVANRVDMLNTRQYLDMRYEAYANDGINWRAPNVTANDLKVWDTTRYTNWQDVLIGGTANYTRVNANVSGGNAGVQYLLGATYSKETTVFPFPDDFADKKANVNFSLTTRSNNQKFKMQFSGNYMYDHNKLPWMDLTQTALILEPVAPPLYTSEGAINWAPNALGNSTWHFNPMNQGLNNYWNKSNNLITNLVVGYKLFRGFEVSTNLGYTVSQTDDFRSSPSSSFAPENRANPALQRSAEYGHREVNSWIIEPQATYRANISAGKMELLIGSTLLDLKTAAGYSRGTGHLSDALLENPQAASSLVIQSNNVTNYRYNALFGRLNYNWRSKYILNLTARRDGSSRFGGKNRFHNFASAGGAWVFTGENFFKHQVKFMSFGKIKGSYGTTGNDQIGDYRFLSLYSFNPVQVAYQGVVGIQPNGLPNPYLQWEETKKLQLGLDLGFFSDRILFGFTWAKNRSSNQLLSYSLPSMSGFSGYLLNFPATVENVSYEFTLNTSNVSTKDFSWTSSANLTIPRNRLVEFPNLATSTYSTQLLIGEPVGINQLYRFAGVDPATGMYQFEDKNGNISTSPSGAAEDMGLRINTSPKYYGGFQNTFSYKKFQVDVLFQFVKQIGYDDTRWGNNMRTPGNFYQGNSNQPVTVLERWQKPGDNTNIARFTSYNSFWNPIRASDRRFVDASYIRLKTLSASWQLPAQWLNRVHFNNCRVFAQGQNLLTITSYKGMDPENQSMTSLPPLRVITIGVTIGI